MSQDSAQAVRLRQRNGLEQPGVRLIHTGDLPEVAYKGQMVYDIDLDLLRVYNGDAWQTVGDSSSSLTYVQSAAPSSPNVGDFWLDTDTDVLSVWDGSAWVDPSLGPDSVGPTEIQAAALTTKHTITGSVFRTAATGNRIQMYDDGSGGVIKGFTGEVGEATPSSINPDFDGDRPTLRLRAGSMTATTGATLTLYGNETGFPVKWTMNSNGEVAGYVEAERFYSSAANTGSGDDAVLDTGDGQLKRKASSRRYKKDIEPLAISVETLLSLEPRQFRYIDNPKKAAAGFIAEEAAGHGLNRWVTHDANGQVEGFKYADWTAALQKICRAQQVEIDELKTRVANLERLVTEVQNAIRT